MRLLIATIPHSAQRYPTVGDWIPDEIDPDQLIIHISEMRDWRYEFLVAVHEQIEAMLCKKEGIAEAAVSAFDLMFEEEREAGLHTEEAEPGDDPRAPYNAAHKFATGIERIIAMRLGVNWETYEKVIQSL